MVCWTNTALGFWSDLAKVRQDKETEIPAPFSLQELRPLHRWVIILVDYVSLHNFFPFFCVFCIRFDSLIFDFWPWSGKKDFLKANEEKLAAGESINLMGFDHPDKVGERRVCKRFAVLNWHFLPGIRGLGHWWEVGTDWADIEIGAWSWECRYDKATEQAAQNVKCLSGLGNCCLAFQVGSWLSRLVRLFFVAAAPCLDKDLVLPDQGYCTHCCVLWNIGAQRGLLLHCERRTLPQMGCESCSFALTYLFK